MDAIIYTAKEAAVILDCVPQTIAKWCKKHQIGRKLGGDKSRQPWILTQNDIERLRAIQTDGAEFVKQRFGRAMKHAVKDDLAKHFR